MACTACWRVFGTLIRLTPGTDVRMANPARTGAVARGEIISSYTDGRPATIPAAGIHRKVPMDTPVALVRRVEELAADAWPAEVVLQVDGWRLRWNAGATRR